MDSALEPFIHRKIVVLSDKATAFQASRALCDNQIGCVVVSDERGRITGLVTDRDLVCSLLSMNLSPDTSLKDLMTRAVVTIDERDSLNSAIELMERFGFRRVPVLNADRSGNPKCVGLITLDDLIAANVIDPRRASRIVQSQIRTRHAPYLRMHVDTVANNEEFLDTFAKECGLGQEPARSVALFVMSAITRRLNYFSAVQFIIQAPK